jgi:hypothetical protein
MRLESLVSPMSNPSVRLPICNSFHFRSLIVAFQVTLQILRIWLLRLSSDCDLVSPLRFTVGLESGDPGYSGLVS